MFGAILGAAIVGGRALVDTVKVKAFDTALIPLAKGAAAGAVAGFVVQVIGFRILDEFFDALAGDVPDPIFLGIYSPCSGRSLGPCSAPWPSPRSGARTPTPSSA